MTHTYHISGMTCNGCVSKVKNELLKVPDIQSLEVQLQAPQATITMGRHIPLSVLQSTLKQAGNYTITGSEAEMADTKTDEESATWFTTYKPILLIFLYISVVTYIVATSVNGFDWMLGMRIFMSGFFLTFSFFKLLDLTGFADSYSTYDIIAKKARAWGFIYPFIELLLGIAYAVNYNPFITNAATLIVMGISLIGVLQSVLNKRKIKCACLGAVFNLPMSTVTIVEDALMIAMSAVMLMQLS